jgi:hypothetical protein
MFPAESAAGVQGAGRSIQAIFACGIAGFPAI